MPDETPTRSRSLFLLRLYFLSAALLGLIALALLLGERSAGGGLLLGYSAPRLALAAGMLALTGFFSALFIFCLRSAAWQERLAALPARLEHPPAYAAGLLLSLTALLLGAFLVTLTPEIEEPFTRGLLHNLQPVAAWLAGFGSLSLILVLLLGPIRWRQVWRRNPVFWIALGGFLLLFLAWAWVLCYRFALDSPLTGWNSLGAPILETQVLLAALAGLAVLWIAHQIRTGRLAGLKQRLPLVDLAAVALLWLLAVALWNATTMPPSWFVTAPRPPNFEHYPNSDALGYDLSAQNLLIGEGLEFKNTPFIPRPVHTLFLFLLHAAGGQDYQAVAFLQTLALAFIPALVYLLAVRLDNRAAGIIASLLLIFREANSIRVSDAINVSHARSLMSDLPATLALILFALLTVRWLQHHEHRPWYSLVLGGILGGAVLIRPEAGIQLVPLLILAALVLRSWRKWFRSALLVGLGLLLVLGPWVYRNYTQTGLVFLNSPTFRFELFQQRYRLFEPTPQGPAPSPSPAEEATTRGETGPIEAPSPTSAPADGKAAPSIVRRTLDFAAANSAEVAGFVASNYTNSQLQLLLQLPTTVRFFDSAIAFYGHRSFEQFEFECCSVLGYIRRLPYWRKWDGLFLSQSLVPLALNALLIAAGLNRAWKKERWIGMAPLLLSATHLGINALVRNSGGRYILPFDWVAVLYFSFGLALVMDFFLRRFASESAPALEGQAAHLHNDTGFTSQAPSAGLLRSPAFYAWMIVLLASGLLLPVLENSIPVRYTGAVQRQMVESLLESPLLPGAGSEKRQEWMEFVQNEAIIRVGRGMYPNFYEQDAGEPGSPNPLGPLPFSRLGFYYVGYEAIPVLLPMDQPPKVFENASDLLILSCPDGETAAVAVFASLQEPLALYLRAGLPEPPRCPLY